MGCSGTRWRPRRGSRRIWFRRIPSPGRSKRAAKAPFDKLRAEQWTQRKTRRIFLKGLNQTGRHVGRVREPGQRRPVLGFQTGRVLRREFSHTCLMMSRKIGRSGRAQRVGDEGELAVAADFEFALPVYRILELF